MDQGGVREEIVVGNACGGKPGNACGGKQYQGDTAESHIEDGAITIASLPQQASIGS